MLDIRKNLLMARVVRDGKISYNFYTLLGLYAVVSAEMIGQIITKQYEGRIWTDIIWGDTTRMTKTYVYFDQSGEILIDAQYGPMRHHYIPYAEAAKSDDKVPLIRALVIDEKMWATIRTHLRAVIDNWEHHIVWTNDLSDEDKRDFLKALGQGWMFVEEATDAEMAKRFEQYQRSHDEKFKYTHNAIGLEEDEIPENVEYDDEDSHEDEDDEELEEDEFANWSLEELQTFVVTQNYMGPKDAGFKDRAALIERILNKGAIK